MRKKSQSTNNAGKADMSISSVYKRGTISYTYKRRGSVLHLHQASGHVKHLQMTTESADGSMMSSLEQTLLQPEMPEGTNPSSKKVKSSSVSQSSSKKKVKKFPVRRSERILNSTPRNHKTPHVIEQITLTESDDEDELPTDHEKNLPHTNQERVLPEMMVGEKNLEAKIDHLIQLHEAQGHSINSLKTELIKNSFSNETTPAPNLKYKSMYIASQKKIEELSEENRELTKKLENAHDQFEAYKKGIQDVFEVFEKLKDVILVSNVSKVSEADQATTQAEVDNVVSADAGEVPSAKRKKLSKKN